MFVVFGARMAYIDACCPHPPVETTDAVEARTSSLSGISSNLRVACIAPVSQIHSTSGACICGIYAVNISLWGTSIHGRYSDPCAAALLCDFRVSSQRTSFFTAHIGRHHDLRVHGCYMICRRSWIMFQDRRPSYSFAAAERSRCLNAPPMPMLWPFCSDFCEGMIVPCSASLRKNLNVLCTSASASGMFATTSTHQALPGWVLSRTPNCT